MPAADLQAARASASGSASAALPNARPRRARAVVNVAALAMLLAAAGLGRAPLCASAEGSDDGAEEELQTCDLSTQSYTMLRRARPPLSGPCRLHLLRSGRRLSSAKPLPLSQCLPLRKPRGTASQLLGTSIFAHDSMFF